MITTMDPLLAQLHKIATGSTLGIDNRGYAAGWINSDDWISWDFKMFSKGEYELQVVTVPGGGPGRRGPAGIVLVKVNLVPVE